mmetsp:Transcript_13624/g.21471  ORF Transcript_13624/g.21471 Transcript_13624/m.21471 type:complete len:138 (+) Transcript_13624:240-653(+)
MVCLQRLSHEAREQPLCSTSRHQMDPGGKYGPEGGAVCGPALADSLRGVSIHRRCNQVIRGCLGFTKWALFDASYLPNSTIRHDVVPSKQEALGFRIVAFYMYFTFRTVWLFLAAAGTLTVPWQPPCEKVCHPHKIL